MSGFGAGLGTVIGADLGAQDLSQGLSNVSGNSANFSNAIGPYNQFGQSFISPATSGINNLQTTADSTQGYDQFMSGYTNTPAAQYQLQQTNAGQNNSAAAKGGLLSGANERALGTLDTGIVAQGANNAYNEYLSGNSQQFGQLETTLGNMFQAIGVGTTVTGQQAGVTASQNSADASIAAAQAKNSQSKGSGIGSMFSGIGSLATMF